jgi:Uncharacterised protein family (UPF0182)
MFLTAYLMLLVLAALPLARTISTGRSGQPAVLFLHRVYRDLAYIAAAVLAIIGFETALNISLQVYWFGELGQSYRYWLALGLRLAILFTLLISIGAFIGYNLRLLCRPLPAVPPTAPWFAALVIAALIGFGATTLWMPLLGFLGATGTGAVDPVFGKDIAFYLLGYDAVVAIVITAVVMTIALWALMGLAFYPSTGRPWHQPAYRLRWSGGRALRVIDPDDAESWTESEMVWRSWLRQGLMLANARSNGRAASQRPRIFSSAPPPALPLQPTKQDGGQSPRPGARSVSGNAAAIRIGQFLALRRTAAAAGKILQPQ